jgi:hypothetical protein
MVLEGCFTRSSHKEFIHLGTHSHVLFIESTQVNTEVIQELKIKRILESKGDLVGEIVMLEDVMEEASKVISAIVQFDESIGKKEALLHTPNANALGPDINNTGTRDTSTKGSSHRLQDERNGAHPKEIQGKFSVRTDLPTAHISRQNNHS